MASVFDGIETEANEEDDESSEKSKRSMIERFHSDKEDITEPKINKETDHLELCRAHERPSSDTAKPKCVGKKICGSGVSKQCCIEFRTIGDKVEMVGLCSGSDYCHWKQYCREKDWSSGLSTCANIVADRKGLTMKAREEINQYNIRRILGLSGREQYNHISKKIRDNAERTRSRSDYCSGDELEGGKKRAFEPPAKRVEESITAPIEEPPAKRQKILNPNVLEVRIVEITRHIMNTENAIKDAQKRHDDEIIPYMKKSLEVLERDQEVLQVALKNIYR